jgi:hypothetical protein
MGTGVVVFFFQRRRKIVDLGIDFFFFRLKADC